MKTKKKKIKKSKKDRNIIQLFFHAIGTGEICSVNYMLSQKMVKPNVLYICGNALHFALIYECPAEKLKKMFQILIAEGVDVNAKHPITKDTPLHILAEKTCFDFNSRLKKALAFLLVASGANIKAKNENGKTPVKLLHRNTGKEMRDIFSGDIKDINFVVRL